MGGHSRPRFVPAIRVYAIKAHGNQSNTCPLWSAAEATDAGEEADDESEDVYDDDQADEEYDAYVIEVQFSRNSTLALRIVS